MLPHSSTVDALGVATLVLVIAVCLASLFCIAYVLYFRSQIRRGHLLALQEFNSVWLVRIILITCAMSWGLIELLRLPLLRHKGAPFHSWGFQQQAALCQAHTVLSFGVMEPCFFLTALFLVKGSVQDAPFAPLRKWNQKTISLILGCRMVALVINKRLQIRVCGLVLSLAILLPVQVFFMGLSVLSIPGNLLFELMAFLSFLTVLLCILVGEGILVVQPILDAMAVRWVFNSLSTSTHHITFDPFSVPLFVFGNEEDANACPWNKESGSAEADQLGKNSTLQQGSMST